MNVAWADDAVGPLSGRKIVNRKFDPLAGSDASRPILCIEPTICSSGSGQSVTKHKVICSVWDEGAQTEQRDELDSSVPRSSTPD